MLLSIVFCAIWIIIYAIWIIAGIVMVFSKDWVTTCLSGEFFISLGIILVWLELKN